MAKSFAGAFYKSKTWQRCRDTYFTSQHGLCERCGGAGWIVHHKVHLTPSNINDTNVTLNFNNLELLCQECHNREHGGASTTDGLMFDKDGNLIQVSPPILKD